MRAWPTDDRAVWVPAPNEGVKMLHLVPVWKDTQALNWDLYLSLLADRLEWMVAEYADVLKTPRDVQQVLEMRISGLDREILDQSGDQISSLLSNFLECNLVQRGLALDRIEWGRGQVSRNPELIRQVQEYPLEEWTDLLMGQPDM